MVEQVESYADGCMEKYGTRLFFCGDELYLKAGLPLHDEAYYEEFLQIENGVGMMASMEAEFDLAMEDRSEYNGGEKVISVATGYAAYGFISALAKKTEAVADGKLRINVYAIRNDFFGENITVAGLLTAQDIIAQLKGKELGETLLLPAVTLRAEGDLFLDGLSPEDVSRELSVPVCFIKNDGGELMDAFNGAL